MKSLVFMFLLLSSSLVNAAIISVGNYDIDELNFADSASFVTPVPSKQPSNAIGFDFNSFVSVDPGQFLAIGFDNNPLFNGVGIDILVFELGAFEESTLALVSGGPSINGTLLQSITNYPGGLYQINIYGFDLSDLGLSEDTFYNSNLFVSSLAGGPDIGAIAAINEPPSNLVSAPSPSMAFILALTLIIICCKNRLNRYEN